MAKVLFLSTNAATFRATFIGYLHEVAQRHEVVLLTEQIDEQSTKILQNRKLFPGLQEIMFFESPFHGNILNKNYRLYHVLKHIIQSFEPDIAVAHSDIWPAEMYFMRLAKRTGSATVALQPGFKIAEQKRLLRWSCLMNAYNRMPRFLPFGPRMVLVRFKKWVGHVLYHWILPLSVGEAPFKGKTSFLFWYESSGLRDADYATVFSKRDHEICVKDGVPPEKVFIIGHPLEHKSTRSFFDDVYFAKEGKQENQKIVTVMWPLEPGGFEEVNYKEISPERMQEKRMRAVRLIAQKLPDWKIFIKSHPTLQDVLGIKKLLGQVSANVVVVDPKEPADAYIEKSRVVIGLPPPSTTLFTASKQNPEIIILSLNLWNEFLGDSYKEFEGIEYIDTEEKFTRILDAIREGRYEKKESNSSTFDFSDANELIEYIYAKRIR